MWRSTPRQKDLETAVGDGVGKDQSKTVTCHSFNDGGQGGLIAVVGPWINTAGVGTAFKNASGAH